MTQEAIEQAVDAVFSALPPLTRVWIGYSGGMDSHVLLDAACRVMNRLPQLGGIHPIHIHHGLHPDADQWTAHCQSVCADLGLICRVIQVDAANTEGKGPERSAREARYAAYQSVIKPGDELLLAHHQNDQAETLLLQLFRGAGPNGLAAMPRCQTFGVGQIWRPFLHLSRDMLRQYAESHALKWVEDTSNADLAMDRNYLRHQVIPAIRERWPQVDATIARSARMCAEISHWVEDQLAEKHADLNANPLPVRLLASQTQPAQRLLLRAWLKQVGLIVPSEQRLGEMLRQILDAEADAQVCLAHDQHEIRRHDQHVYVLKPLPNEAAEWSAALSTGSVELPNGLGRVSLSRDSDGGLDLKKCADARLCIRFRRGGERIRLPGHQHRQSLKHLFQEARIPPWVRTRVPLLYADEQLVAVGPYWIAADWASGSGQMGLALHWDADWNRGSSETDFCN